MMRSMALSVTAGLLLTGCSVTGDDPEVASLPPVFGARVTDGRVQLSTGTPCTNVSRVVVTFTPGAARLILSAPQGVSTGVETLTIGGPYPGLDVVEAPPESFDWRSEREVLMIVDADPAGAGATPTGIADIIDGSDANPGSFYYAGIGWLDPAEVAERNGRSLLTACTPDPGSP